MISPQLRKQAVATIKRLPDFIRRHILWFALAAVGSFTAAAVIRRKSNRVSTIGDALSVQRAKAETLRLEKLQAEITAQDQAKANEILRLNAAIVEQQKVIAEAATGTPWEKLTDEQVRAALREAGL